MPNNVTLDWTEYEGLKNRIKSLENQLTATAPPDPVNETAQSKALAAALEAVKFAIANLPPETVTGWPWGSLTELADSLEAMGACAPELPITIRAFARECRELTIFRREREKAAEKALFGEENAAPDA